MMATEAVKCARCGKDWDRPESDSIFVTCPACRIPDGPRRPQKFSGAIDNATRHWEESGSSFDNIVRHYEEDR